MTDQLDAILLERFAAQHDPLPASDLVDVRARATKMYRSGDRLTFADARRMRHPIVAAAVVLGAAVLCAAAYAVVRLVIIGSPAPPPVRASEQVLEQVQNSLSGLARSGGRRVDVAKTRAEALLDTGSGPVYLWVAPTRDGNRCMYLQITGLDVRFAGGSPFLMSIGCVDATQPQALLVRVNTGVDGHTLPLVAGYIPPPAKILQLRFADGTTSRQYATTDGFVVALGSRYDPNPSAIVRNRQGRLITPSPVPFIPQRFVSGSPTGVNRFTITVPLPNHKGNLVLKVGPAARGGSCSELQVSSWSSLGGMSMRECGPNKPGPDGIEIRRGYSSMPFHRPAVTVQYLKGQVGTDIATLELVDRDGSRHPLPIHHHWVLSPINPADPPTKIIGRNATGNIVVTQRVNTNVCLKHNCMNKDKVIHAPGRKIKRH